MKHRTRRRASESKQANKQTNEWTVGQGTNKEEKRKKSVSGKSGWTVALSHIEGTSLFGTTNEMKTILLLCLFVCLWRYLFLLVEWTVVTHVHSHFTHQKDIKNTPFFFLIFSFVFFSEFRQFLFFSLDNLISHKVSEIVCWALRCVFFFWLELRFEYTGIYYNCKATRA